MSAKLTVLILTSIEVEIEIANVTKMQYILYTVAILCSWWYAECELNDILKKKDQNNATKIFK